MAVFNLSSLGSPMTYRGKSNKFEKNCTNKQTKKTLLVEEITIVSKKAQW